MKRDEMTAVVEEDLGCAGPISIGLILFVAIVAVSFYLTMAGVAH